LKANMQGAEQGAETTFKPRKRVRTA